ncbi:hypothetical protein BDQ12DRAFT_667737 [Crucibulum laeve]|uniref:Gylcosyl hydrolase 115 C-terminal domain-containing protein n=1 Tax=Crucibulum laeve TaxID=68775 RepID=A0A5C3M662_9AGAR|nr:hypothetical protein BDQ12DRAFT_667737 [Crucibulum laeve]
MTRVLVLAGLCTLFSQVYAIGQDSCVSFKSSSSSFAVVSNGKAAPILVSADDWAGVHLAAADFASDIQKVTSVKATLTNTTSSNLATASKGSLPIIVGTLGKSSLINQIVNSTGLDVSSIQGKWESFLTRQVKNPLPGVASAYVVIGADKRGTIFALYDHSEQFGVSPWYWWADVPTTQHPELFVSSSGCSHGSPTIKYRGIFLNDEQPALQSWAMDNFTNGTGSAQLNSPFNHLFYSKLFELMLRLKANYLWPAMWGSAFAIDDPLNQPLADTYGVVMGTSHQEPMMRSTPNEFILFGKGTWHYVNNADNIKQFYFEGVQRAKNFESIYTLGMRGFGDLPLSEPINIQPLEQVLADQSDLQGLEGYYDDGMPVPDYVTLMWADDNWGNIRRFPIASERNRTGGAGVYYHFDYVGDPRDYKWITARLTHIPRIATTQIEKVYEQMSIAVEREATRLWILNVGDLKPYERETEFFISYGWNATRWSQNNLGDFVTAWAQREFDLSAASSAKVSQIVANLTRFNARRKPELLNSTTYSLINYREAETVAAQWAQLQDASTAIYNSLPSGTKPAFFQLVHHPILASSNIANMMLAAGQNNLRASQARYSVNSLADKVEQLFEKDYDIETQYHTLLDGKWTHMMDQTHLGYYYWQQPMTNTMPSITRVQKNKINIAGVMRIVPEGTLGAWPGDNPNQCAQGYSCPPPSISMDSFSSPSNRYIDVGAGGPIPFTFTATSNASWLTLSPSKGSISPSSPEQRVFASIADWSKLSAGSNSAIITFKATATGQPDLSVTVMFNAQKNTVSSGFKGFVEGDGAISIEAAHATRNNSVSGVAWSELPGYGRTLSAVTPMPRTDANFSAGTGPSLEYDFYNFNTLKGQGNVTVNAYLSPSLNTNGDTPLSLALQIDSLTPQIINPIPAAAPGTLPAAWDTNDGWVANAAVPISATFNGVSPGAHTLKLWMIEPTVVVQKIIINTGGLQPSYLGPPESVLIR